MSPRINPPLIHSFTTTVSPSTMAFKIDEATPASTLPSLLTSIIINGNDDEPPSVGVLTSSSGYSTTSSITTSAMQIVGAILPTTNASASSGNTTNAWPCRYDGSTIAAAGTIPPPPIYTLNASDAAKMLECLASGSTFYDACQRKCYTEMSILHMTQGLQLENVVYGQITPTNVVLKYMAIADLCVGLVPLPWNFFYHTLGYDILNKSDFLLSHFSNSQHDERIQLWWCYMYKYSMDAVPPVCHNIAMWLTVLLAGQRYISIQYPLLSRQLCTVRTVRLTTIVITGVSVLCGLPKSVDYYFEVYEGWAFMEPGKWIYLKSCLSGFTIFVRTFGSNAFFNIYFWTRVFVFILIPSILLIILNALLIRGIRLAKLRKDRLLKEKRAREAQRQKDSNSTSVMLVVIVTIFLVVNLPQAVFMAMLCVQNTFGVSNSILEGDFPAAFLLVSNMLVMATYPINFGIYCFMSSSFRDTFRMFFYRKKWPRNFMARRGTMACGTGYNRYTVRRSDPSLQFSDINCSGNIRTSARFSISDTVVVGNGIRASSATVTVMPFIPLLSDSDKKCTTTKKSTQHSVATLASSADTTTTTTTTATTPIARDYAVGASITDSQNELINSGTSIVAQKNFNIQREISSAKTLESTISNSSYTLRSLLSSSGCDKACFFDNIEPVEISPVELKNVVKSKNNKRLFDSTENKDDVITNKIIETDSVVTMNKNEDLNLDGFSKIDTWKLNSDTETINDSETSERQLPPPSYDETTRNKVKRSLNYWPPPNYTGQGNIFAEFCGAIEKIADIADTDDKIREADAIYL